MADEADMVTLAKAVTDSLNAADFSMEFVAKRDYVPRVSRTGAELRVFVMPTLDDSTIVSRQQSTQHDIGIQVGIICPVEVNSDEVAADQMDRLLYLLQEIKDHVRDADDIVPSSAVTLHRIENQPIFDNQSLRENNEFRSGPTFVFRCPRHA